MFKIIPKNRKLLKSSKVRAWLKVVENRLEPSFYEIEKAAFDLDMYGCSTVLVNEDGTCKHVPYGNMYKNSEEVIPVAKGKAKGKGNGMKKKAC